MLSCTFSRLLHVCHHFISLTNQTALNGLTFSLTCKHLLWHGLRLWCLRFHTQTDDGRLDGFNLTLKDLTIIASRRVRNGDGSLFSHLTKLTLKLKCQLSQPCDYGGHDITIHLMTGMTGDGS